MADYDFVFNDPPGFGFIEGYRRGIVQVSRGFLLRKDSLDLVFLILSYQ